MKAWFIYYLGDLDSISLPCSDDEPEFDRFYGMTNDKKLLKSFMSIRNPELFKIKKMEILPSEYSEVAKNHRGALIDNYNLVTRREDHITKTSIMLTLTANEYQVSTDEDIVEYTLYNDDSWIHSINPSVCNDKLKKALYTLQYVQCWKLITQKNLEDYDDYEAPDFAIDEFHTFISNFSHTLK